MIQFVALGVDLLETAVMAAPAIATAVEGVYNMMTKEEDNKNTSSSNNTQQNQSKERS